MKKAAIAYPRIPLFLFMDKDKVGLMNFNNIEFEKHSTHTIIDTARCELNSIYFNTEAEKHIMDEALQRANNLNVNLTADPTQLAAYQNKVLMMDELEVEWLIKNKTVEEFWIFSEEGISIRFRNNSINESIPTT